MTLGQTQRRFTKYVGQLILQAYKMGYEVSLGDAYRSPRVFGMAGTNKPGVYGHPNSNHKRKLAIDLNLFLDGEYLDATEDHAKLGAWWVALGEKEGLPLRWGGEWGDGNHYTILWKGQR